jgi:hypothetical protein
VSPAGVLGGTLAADEHGLYPVTVTANYGGGITATQNFVLRVGPLITAISPALLVSGGTATIDGFGFGPDIASNALTIDGQAATLTAAGPTQLTATIPCVRQGVYPVRDVIGTRATQDFTTAMQGAQQHSVAPGQSLVVSDAASLDCMELAAAGGTARYVVAVFNAGTSATGSVSVQISGDVTAEDATAPLRPSDTPLARTPLTPEQLRVQAEDVAHQRLLEINEREYARLRARPAVKKAAVPKALPPLTRQFRVANINLGAACNSFYVVDATRVYFDGKLAIYEDDATPAAFRTTGSASMADYINRIGDQYNNDMEPIVRLNFGDPLLRDDLTDNNDVLIALFTPRINNSFAGVAGFVIACDQFANDDATPRVAGGPYTGTGGNGSSNFGEVFYAYQPVLNAAGYGGNTPDNWYRTIRSTFIHETKHVASQAARTQNGAPLEASWLEEGTARHVEELWMREAVDVEAWKSNIPYGTSANPINVYCDVRPGFAECDANARRPASIMQRHFSSLNTNMLSANMRLLSPFGATPSDTQSYWYATSWSLVRYAIDRYGASDAAFLTALTQASETGVANLVARAGVPLDQLLGNWALSFAADDNPLFAVTPSLDIQVPTWNFRSIYAGFNTDFPGTYPLAYPLVPTALSFGHFAPINTTTMYGGGVLYYQLSGTQTEGQLLKLRASGGGARSANLRMAVTRVQ